MLRAKSRFNQFYVHPLGIEIHVILNVLAHGKSCKHVEFGHFLCSDSKFQNTGHCQRICPLDVARALFCEKHDGHKLCVKSRFDRFFMHHLRISKYWSFPAYHEKSYKHGFTKKCNSHKLCAKSHTKSRFDWFFMHRIEISKYWPIPN
ncbi:hypothetical protein B296_00027325 [Ensete ventricosum]|uniref:Uncharacterized protein n=1 Tax=Ensete ventricosum TaxID=4639 RepID=A0A426ZGX7_ENSVE|nr:hypothetical protein B296_00027325 [Ensete ventricosum]